MAWQLAPAERLEQETLCKTLIQIHRDIYDHYFLGELGINDSLPIQIRAYRTIDHWHVCLVLTPWMLARFYLPAEDPELTIPNGWSAAERHGESYVVIGPLIDFTLLGSAQRANLNFDPNLGHYLLQPLVQSMDAYATADDVFNAWNDVIKIRDENIRKAQRDCPLQREVSRREFFARAWRRSPE